MLLIVDCKYQLIKENRVQAKPHIKGDAESREDGLTIKVKDREEVMTLLDEDEPEVEKGHKVRIVELERAPFTRFVWCVEHIKKVN